MIIKEAFDAGFNYGFQLAQQIKLAARAPQQEQPAPELPPAPLPETQMLPQDWLNQYYTMMPEQYYGMAAMSPEQYYAAMGYTPEMLYGATAYPYGYGY